MEKALVTRTSARLRELLESEPDYVVQWNSRIGRQQLNGIHQSAVCHVLADYLKENGLQSDPDLGLARQLKDRVHRALTGQSLSRATLRWFIEAFAMTPADAAELIRLSTPGHLSDTVLGGPAAGSGVLGTPQYATVSLQEWHCIGPDGLPDLHRTVHTVRARGPMRRYSTVYDADAASLQVVRGGAAGRPYPVDPERNAVDIEPDRPLRLGETHTFEYVTRFWPRDTPVPEFRRVVDTPLKNVELRVQFHPLRLPERVWFCQWAATGDEPIAAEEVPLDASRGVGRFMLSMEATVAGFRWTIPDRPRRGSH